VPWDLLAKHHRRRLTRPVPSEESRCPPARLDAFDINWTTLQGPCGPPINPASTFLQKHDRISVLNTLIQNRGNALKVHFAFDYPKSRRIVSDAEFGEIVIGIQESILLTDVENNAVR
jgi:hypothetical protein